MKFVPWNDQYKHAAALKEGLAALGPEFLAKLCYACEGTGMRKFEHCYACGRDKMYGTALGLLQGTSPAPESVVNQVLVAASRKEVT